MVTTIDRSLEFYVKGVVFEKKMDWRPEGRIEWCYIESLARAGACSKKKRQPYGRLFLL